MIPAFPMLRLVHEIDSPFLRQDRERLEVSAMIFGRTLREYTPNANLVCAAHCHSESRVSL